MLSFPAMARLITLIVASTILGSCSSAAHLVVDYMPAWAGGLPKDAPPRPGTPEYDALRQKLETEANRDKSKDAPAPKADPTGLPK
jgi:hypothetical protein